MRPPARLSTSTRNTHTPGRTRHHLSAVRSSPQRASMSRNDTWHSRVRGKTPAQQPPGLPASTGSAGDSDWHRKGGSNEAPGAQPTSCGREETACAAPVARLVALSIFRLHNSCSMSPLGETVSFSAPPDPLQMMKKKQIKIPPNFQELRCGGRTTVLDF